MNITLNNQVGHIPIRINPYGCGFVQNTEQSTTYFLSLKPSSRHNNLLQKLTGYQDVADANFTLNIACEAPTTTYSLAFCFYINGEQDTLVVDDCKPSPLENLLIKHYVFKINNCISSGKIKKAESITLAA